MNKTHPFSPYQKQVAEFLDHSNRIEREYSYEAFEDALEAWEYLEKKDRITLKEVREVHHLLMKRLNPRIAGQFRKCDVRIGGELKMYSGEHDITVPLRELLDLINQTVSHSSKAFSKDDLAKHCHIEFEKIHPFEDGNGRTGRIIYNWHRRQMGLPIEVIHEGKEQREYYKWFRQ